MLIDAASTTLLIMSTAESWDFTVPEDEAELLAELRRHGVRPGAHLNVVETANGEASAGLRRALEAINAAIESGLAEKMRAVVGQLYLPRIDAPSNPQPVLDEAQRAALALLVSALNDAKHAALPDAAEPGRRKLPFIGTGKGGPSDLAANTDAYLAQGFGR